MGIEKGNTCEIIVCPPFTHIYPLKEIPAKFVSLGAQNCSFEAKGAYTGEVSAAMVSSLHIHYVILGHSERRHYFHESPELLAGKVDLALENELIPIFCIGETQKERESGAYFSVLENQIKASLFHLSAESFSTIIMAYEPIWAIGTGLTASPEQAQQVHGFIRKIIAEKYSPAIANQVSILYGGSCNEKNADELFSKPDIDGGLIGGASLKANEFIKIGLSLKHKKSELAHS
jgi:triosephosphate isomerase